MGAMDYWLVDSSIDLDCSYWPACSISQWSSSCIVYVERKLAPEVSPGKTIEGALSAFIATAVYAFIAGKFFSFEGNQLFAFVVLSLVTVVFSILGDLSESMFKRHAGVKDSGTILPGHGGILDRIDSVTAAAPVFVVGLWLADFDLLQVPI